MLKATIFDLDGTLIDSRQDLVDSVNGLLAELGLPALPDATVVGFIGEGAARLVSRALAAAQPGLEARTGSLMPSWFDHYGKRLLRTTRAFAGIDEVLRAPPEARAVLTNKPGVFSRQILQGLGLLPRFRAVVGGDEAARKPSPEGLLRLCERLGARPEEALLVGDSQVDLDTGRAAGVPVCIVGWGLGDVQALRAQRPAHVVTTTDDLADLLRRLSAA